MLIRGICFLAALSGMAALGADSSTSIRAAAATKPVALSPVEISDKPVGSFGLGFKATVNFFGHKVLDLKIDAVYPDSEADRIGLVPLTQILSIDGKDVGEFTATFVKGSELNKELMNRKVGDKITLEVLLPGARASRFVTLTEAPREVSSHPHSVAAVFGR